MANRFVDLELLPWFHQYTLESHKMILEYIRSLPRGSALIMEIDEPQQLEFEKYMSDPESYKIDHLPESDFERNKKLWKLAGYELYLECLKRGIKVIRIEESTVRRMTSNIGENAKSWDEIKQVEKFLSKRDNVMARRIMEAIKAHKNNKFYILVGQGHIEGIIKNIVNLRIPNTEIRAYFNREIINAIYPEQMRRMLAGKYDGERNASTQELKTKFDAWKKAKQDRLIRKLQESLRKKPK